MNLTELANKYGSDKGDKAFEAHNYTPTYERIIGAYPDNLKLLEIGVFDPRFPGASAKMWHEWRPRASLFGIDINPSAKVLETETAMKVYIADQNNPDQLNTVMKDIGRVDVILDDGSHFLNHIGVSLMSLWDHLNQGGVYIIEDLHAPQSQPRHSLDFIVDDLAKTKTLWMLDDKVLMIWK